MLIILGLGRVKSQVTGDASKYRKRGTQVVGSVEPERGRKIQGMSVRRVKKMKQGQGRKPIVHSSCNAREGSQGTPAKVMMPSTHQKNHLQEIHQGKTNFKQLSQIKVTNDTRIVRGQGAIYAKDFSSSPNFTTVICTLKKTSLLASLGT